MFWDSHMHCNFSGDSEASPESMIEQAIQLGLPGLCFTDHLDYDYPSEPDLFVLDLDSYQEKMLALKEKYANRFPLHFGIELGLQPHLAEKLTSVVTEHPFDFVIGSSHVVHGFDPYYGGFFENRTEEDAYYEYFASIIENLQAFQDFDVYGHIDYVVRYGPTKNKNYTYQKYADIIDQVLRALIEAGKGIEINTGGFKYGLGHPNPTEDVIRRYRELGGEIITIGADAHAPEHVAYDFEKVAPILLDCGFKYYTVFEKRKPQFIHL